MKKEQLFKKELASAICMDFNGQLKALGGYVDVAPPEYIGEKLMFVNMEIARRILEHRTLNDFREQALTLLKAEDKYDWLADEVFDKLKINEGGICNDDIYIHILRILQNVLEDIHEKSEFLMMLGFSQPQLALQILLKYTKESDTQLIIKELSDLEKIETDEKKVKFVLSLSVFYYLYQGMDKKMLKKTGPWEALLFMRQYRIIVQKYRKEYDRWKMLNIFSLKEQSLRDMQRREILASNSEDFVLDPERKVESIFMSYYNVYDNYSLFFDALSRLSETDGQTCRIVLSVLVDSEYNNELYEAYVDYCIKQKTEPVLHFKLPRQFEEKGTDAISEDVFEKSCVNENVDVPYLDLGKPYAYITRLYEELLHREWIDKETDFNTFLFVFSGKCKPEPLKTIKWIYKTNELAYLIYCLCMEADIRPQFAAVQRHLFDVPKDLKFKKRNLSALADALRKERKAEVKKMLSTL